MRLKEDKSNWKASNLIRKIALPPEESHHKSKKDTRKWCRGKVGVNHSFVLIKKTESQWFSFALNKCVNCGKKKYT